jgi:hypothetical protein
MIAARSDLSIGVRRGRARLEPEGPEIYFEGYRYRLYALPVPGDASETDIVLGAAGLARQEQLMRHSGREFKGDRAEDFVEELVGTISILIDATTASALSTATLRYSEVAHLLLEQRPAADDARMALIVRHAKELEKLIVALGERPRQVLKRIRAMAPIAQTAELDRGCIEWYMRQPGRTTAEKAGGRQRLLAVQRRETRDTLENRVLVETLRLSARAAGRYVDANRRFLQRPRVQRVRRYGRVCHDLVRSPSLDGIRRLESTPTPNYPLLFDPRYRLIWKAYCELQRDQEADDEAFRWQHRLWADLVRIATTTALTRPEVQQGGKVVTSLTTPLLLRSEQAHGRYSIPLSVPNVILLDTGVNSTVLEAIDTSGISEKPSEVEYAQLLVLGPMLLLRLQHLTMGCVGWIPIWAIPQCSSNMGLTIAVESAGRALRQARDSLKAHGKTTMRVYGIVFAPGRLKTGIPEFTDSAAGMTLCVAECEFSDGIYLVRGLIRDAIDKYLFAS